MLQSVTLYNPILSFIDPLYFKPTFDIIKHNDLYKTRFLRAF